MRPAVALALLLAATGALAQEPAAVGDAADRAAQERAAREQLTRVRAEIAALGEQMRATTGARGDALRELREQELAVAAAARELHALDARIQSGQDELAALTARRDERQRALAGQREALAALLRSAYALGRDEELKLLLQQDDVATIARVLAYHRYFQRARLDHIDGLLKDLAELAELQQTIERRDADLVAARVERVRDAAALETQRAAREALLAELDGRLKDQQARLAAVGKDEKGLLELIERLRDVFADIPRQLVGAEPFRSLRGRLDWPLRGKVQTAFGASDESGRRSAGLLIAAPAGAPVRAVAHGRVAFADWLKGYGLLLIVDHGDGYMSLYGNNEALLKEVGDWVRAGDAIASSGASGGQKSPGLYFELREQGKPLDPRGWLK